MRRRIALALCVSLPMGTPHAREPSRLDLDFCDHYASTMQQALTAERSGNPETIARFRQSVIRDPQAYLLLPDLGVSQTTPPWVTDITEESRDHCLQKVRLNHFGNLPGDLERPKSESAAESQVTIAAVLPSKRDETELARISPQAGETTDVPPISPPAGDTFEGTFSSKMGTAVKVTFQRHSALCWGRTLATVPRKGNSPERTCDVSEQPGAYVVQFSQYSSFGKVIVPFATMRPAASAP